MANLHIDQIAKSFGQTQVLRGVSLHIEDGEFISLVGPSGCGKSTLLRIIAGLESQDSGDIQINNTSMAGTRAADRNLSMVFQSYALYPHLSVGENIAVPLRMRQLNTLQRLPLIGPLMPGARAARTAIQQAVTQAATTLEIDALLNRKPGQLSGGQRQRVALGRALVRDPAAFLLDEPLSNLDAKLRVQTRTEIAELHRRLGATFVYVTHDQVEAMTMSSRIAVMMSGEILQCGAPDVVYDDPDDIRVAEFIGSPKINILPATLQAQGQIHLLDTPLQLFTRKPHDSVQIGLRPEMIELAPAEAPAHDTRYAQLTGTLAHLENLGSELYAQIEVPGLPRRLILRAAPRQRSALHMGAPVALRFDTTQALIFDGVGKRVRHLLHAPDASWRQAS